MVNNTLTVNALEATVILYGGRLSPFVRRVELWLALQGRQVERRYVSVFADNFDGVAAINPLGRVPVLTTDSGEHLFETSAIVDYLEDTAEPVARLLPSAGPARWQVMQILALSHGIAEKGIALYYETHRRPQQYQWSEWQERLTTQISNGLRALDAAVDDNLPAPGAIEIAACCAYDINTVTFPALIDPAFTRLKAMSDRANAHPAFAATYPVPS
jgi:glutathione S-transferase